jgi:hypothetical protein
MEKTGNNPHKKVLATWMKVRSKTSLIQSNSVTNLDLWNTTLDMAFTSNIEILKFSQSEALRMTVAAS